MCAEDNHRQVATYDSSLTSQRTDSLCGAGGFPDQLHECDGIIRCPVRPPTVSYHMRPEVLTQVFTDFPIRTYVPTFQTPCNTPNIPKEDSSDAVPHTNTHRLKTQKTAFFGYTLIILAVKPGRWTDQKTPGLLHNPKFLPLSLVLSHCAS